jgi:hypothetical protein
MGARGEVIVIVAAAGAGLQRLADEGPPMKTTGRPVLAASFAGWLDQWFER